jgi:hypothetical protein
MTHTCLLYNRRQSLPSADWTIPYCARTADDRQTPRLETTGASIQQIQAKLCMLSLLCAGWPGSLFHAKSLRRSAVLSHVGGRDCQGRWQPLSGAAGGLRCPKQVAATHAHGLRCPLSPNLQVWTAAAHFAARHHHVAVGLRQVLEWPPQTQQAAVVHMTVQTGTR